MGNRIFVNAVLGGTVGHCIGDIVTDSPNAAETFVLFLLIIASVVAICVNVAAIAREI